MLALFCVTLAVTLALALPAGANPDEESVVQYRIIDTTFADVTSPVVTGATRLPTGTTMLTGAYVDRFHDLHGWFGRAGGRSIALPRLVPQDVSAVGITGWYRADAVTPAGGIFTWGFVWHEGHFETLTGPSLGPRQPWPTLVAAISINDAGCVCGDWRHPLDGRFRGFLYDPTTKRYTVLEVPDAVSTACLHVAQDGQVLVRAITSAGSKTYWVWEAGTLTPLVVPELPADVDLVAHQGGILAGNDGMAGFVWDGTTLHDIDVPDSTLTEVHGLQSVTPSRLRVYGRSIGDDGVHHGFLATLTLTEQARTHARARGRSARLGQPFTAAHCWEGSKRALCRER